MSARDNGRPGPFEVALDRVFDRNEETGKGPTSVRALAKELAAGQHGPQPTHAQIEDWRRRLRRYVSGERHPRPTTIALIATASGAQIEDFPRPRSHEDALLERVEELTLEVERLQALLAREQP